MWKLGSAWLQALLPGFDQTFFLVSRIFELLFDEKIDFWPKLRLLTKLRCMTNISTFAQNCDQNFDFLPNLRFMIKIMFFFFDTIFDFWPKLRLLTYNITFLTRSRRLPKLTNFDQNIGKLRFFWQIFRFFYPSSWALKCALTGSFYLAFSWWRDYRRKHAQVS